MHDFQRYRPDFAIVARMVNIGQVSRSPHPLPMLQLEYALLWIAARPVTVHLDGPLAIYWSRTRPMTLVVENMTIEVANHANGLYHSGLLWPTENKFVKNEAKDEQQGGQRLYYIDPNILPSSLIQV